MSIDYNNYETSYTSYGAGGGAGGGGFIPGEGSQQSPGGQRNYSQDSLRAVTIKQILEAQGEAGSNDAFKIDGTVISQVCNVSMFADLILTPLPPAHICRPNTQHLNADYKHDIQAR
jgi:replication factor A2